MPDPLDTVTQAKKHIEKDKEMEQIVDQALAKRRRRRKMASACADRLSSQEKPKMAYDKLAMLVPSVNKVLQNCQYGAAAGGFKPSVRTDNNNGLRDKKLKKEALFPGAIGTGIGAAIGAGSSEEGNRLAGAGHGAGIGFSTDIGAQLGAIPGVLGGGALGLLGGPLAPITVPAGMVLGGLGGAGLGGYGGYRLGDYISERGSGEAGQPWDRPAKVAPSKGENKPEGEATEEKKEQPPMEEPKEARDRFLSWGDVCPTNMEKQGFIMIPAGATS